MKKEMVGKMGMGEEEGKGMKVGENGEEKGMEWEVEKEDGLEVELWGEEMG